jgi:serine/threonine-protein kinase
MGVVYLARHLALNRAVALKMIIRGAFTPAEALRRFEAEAQSLAQLQHPNIVQVFDYGQFQGSPYLTLEYLEGGNLERHLGHRPQPPHAAAALVATLAEAVAAAHAKGVVHCDLKPANVLLTVDGTPKISDFGLARTVWEGGRPMADGAILGTPAYMAPEQAAGRPEGIGPATDVYGLGALLYECLTGRPPFVGDSPLETLVEVLTLEPPAPRDLQAGIPADLETICLTCLHKDAGRRYPTAATLAAEIGRFLRGEPIHARRRGWAERWGRGTRRRLAHAGLLAVAAAAGYAAAAIRLPEVPPAPPPAVWAEQARHLKAQLEQARAELEAARHGAGPGASGNPRNP